MCQQQLLITNEERANWMLLVQDDYKCIASIGGIKNIIDTSAALPSFKVCFTDGSTAHVHFEDGFLYKAILFPKKSSDKKEDQSGSGLTKSDVIELLSKWSLLVSS